jgi:hypothetical protein
MVIQGLCNDRIVISWNMIQLKEALQMEEFLREHQDYPHYLTVHPMNISVPEQTELLLSKFHPLNLNTDPR